MLRSYNRHARKCFTTELQETNWNDIPPTGVPVAEMWSRFKSVWDAKHDECFPLEERRDYKPDRINLPDWLVTKVREKRAIFRAFYNSGGSERTFFATKP